jgi:hypothetical protein
MRRRLLSLSLIRLLRAIRVIPPPPELPAPAEIQRMPDSVMNWEKKP